MIKIIFFPALCLFLALGCGAPRGVVDAPRPVSTTAPSNPLPAPAAAPTMAATEGEQTGPFLPPEIPPTVYAPLLRRATTAAPPLPAANNQCHLSVEVHNYDGLDGCGLLLETDAGNLFIVGNTPRGEPLEAGTRISIGFEYMTKYDGANCANADAIIRITCMRLLRVSSGVPQPVVCEAYDKPAQWLHTLAKDYSATYITRFPWDGDRYAYLVESPFGQYLYDCRGYLICKPRKNCLGFVEDFSAGVIIYEG